MANFSVQAKAIAATWLVIVPFTGQKHRPVSTGCTVCVPQAAADVCVHVCTPHVPCIYAVSKQAQVCLE